MKISASIPTIIIMLFAFASVHAKLGASHDIVDDAIDETLDPIYVGEGDERLLEENRERKDPTSGCAPFVSLHVNSLTRFASE